MVTRHKHWFTIGLYTLLGIAYGINHIAIELSHCSNSVDPILVGDLNVYLYQTEDREHKKYLMAMLVSESLKDMDNHFRPRWGWQDRRSWIMIRVALGGVVLSRITLGNRLEKSQKLRSGTRTITITSTWSSSAYKDVPYKITRAS